MQVLRFSFAGTFSLKCIYILRCFLWLLKLKDIWIIHQRYMNYLSKIYELSPKVIWIIPDPTGLNFKHNKWSDAWLQYIKPYKAASWRRLLKYRFDCTLQLPMHKVRMLSFVSFLKTKVKGIKCVHKMASRRRLQKPGIRLWQMTDHSHLSPGICHLNYPLQ